MKTKIINIGNSQGLIIPLKILNQLNLTTNSSIKISVENGNIIIKPAPRQGWAEAAKQMNILEDDRLLTSNFPTYFDKEEWTW